MNRSPIERKAARWPTLLVLTISLTSGSAQAQELMDSEVPAYLPAGAIRSEITLITLID